MTAEPASDAEIECMAFTIRRWAEFRGVPLSAVLAKLTAPQCHNHPDRPSITNLDGDELCQECANAWVQGERDAAPMTEKPTHCRLADDCTCRFYSDGNCPNALTETQWLKETLDNAERPHDPYVIDLKPQQ